MGKVPWVLRISDSGIAVCHSEVVGIGSGLVLAIDDTYTFSRDSERF